MVLLESLKIKLGEPALPFNLKGIDDKIHSLETYSDKKVLVVVFMCNHCPYVQAVWSRLNKLQLEFADKGVQFVGINPNLNPDYPDETFEKMKEYAQKFEMNFPYLQDDTQEVARAYKAQCTPDIYVYDEQRKLAYHGRIDDSWKDESKVTKRELAAALQNLVEGKNAPEMQNPSMGCSIKWRTN